MNIGFGLNLEQSQKLIMTPELRQAIKLLQYNSIELEQFIVEQIEVNPLLEMEKPIHEAEEQHENTKKEEIDWKEYINNYDDISYVSQGANTEKENPLENMFATEETLSEHLLFQLEVSDFDESEKSIGRFIIDNIDDNGYLKANIEEMASFLCVEKLSVESVLSLIQDFEPVGVGARNLAECLVIQLKHKGIKDEDTFLIIDKYLEEIGENRISKISKETKISPARVQEIIDIIKSLNPKPGSMFGNNSEKIRYVVPDVTLKEVDGEHLIIVNDSTAPRLRINDFYKQMINSANSETSDFISEKLNAAMWIIKSIEQRRNTIYKVVEAIYNHQKEFFDKGELHLKPLTLKEIADEIEMHESTVSRTTNGKYIQTDRGTFELKYFFSSKLNAVDHGDEDVSSTAIKSQIKEMIKAEDNTKPLSDQVIVEKLAEQNIQISRRTVAKYREEMNIPSSSGRRRHL